MDHPSPSLPRTGWLRALAWMIHSPGFIFLALGPRSIRLRTADPAYGSKPCIQILPQAPTGAQNYSPTWWRNANQHLPRRRQTLFKNSDLTLIRHGDGVVQRRTSRRKIDSHLGLCNRAERQWPWEADCPNPLVCPHAFIPGIGFPSSEFHDLGQVT